MLAFKACMKQLPGKMIERNKKCFFICVSVAGVHLRLERSPFVKCGEISTRIQMTLQSWLVSHGTWHLMRSVFLSPAVMSFEYERPTHNVRKISLMMEDAMKIQYS